MAEPSNQSAILRIAQFFRLSDINRTVPDSIWSAFPSIPQGERKLIEDQARQVVSDSKQVEGLASGWKAVGNLTLYPDSSEVEYRVKVRFTRSDGSQTYRTYRNKTSAAAGPQGVVKDIESFVGDISRRYGYEYFDILFDSLIVWGN